MIYQDGKVFIIFEVGQAISIEIYLEYCNIRKNDIFSNIYSLASILILSDILAVLNYVEAVVVYHSTLILHTCPRAFKISRKNKLQWSLILIKM